MEFYILLNNLSSLEIARERIRVTVDKRDIYNMHWLTALFSNFENDILRRIEPIAKVIFTEMLDALFRYGWRVPENTIEASSFKALFVSFSEEPRHRSVAGDFASLAIIKFDFNLLTVGDVLWYNQSGT